MRQNEKLQNFSFRHFEMYIELSISNLSHNRVEQNIKTITIDITIKRRSNSYCISDANAVIIITSGQLRANNRFPRNVGLSLAKIVPIFILVCTPIFPVLERTQAKLVEVAGF